MKKILSIFLAVLMAFSAISFTASAATEKLPETNDTVEVTPSETPECEGEHQWGAWKYTQKATCTEKGIKCRVCSVCGTPETEMVNAAGHTWGEEEKVEASCSSEGYTFKKCTKCGEIEIDKKDVIAALPHTYGEFETKAEPTCTETGLKERKCSVCEYVDSVDIPVLGHDTIEEVFAPDYDKDGYTLIKCKRCDYSVKKEGSETDKLTGRVLNLELGDTITMNYEDTLAINVMEFLEIGGEVTVKPEKITYEVIHRLSEQTVVEATKEEDSKIITLTAKGMGNATLKVTVEDEYGNKVDDEVTIQVNFSILDWFRLIGSILIAAIKIVLGGLDFSSLGQLFG